jgi:hypothetical protein
MDPPWGGVDYAVFGKNGYDLERNMKIQRPISSSSSIICKGEKDCTTSSGSDLNGFFDTFQTLPRSKEERKAQFNYGLDESNCINGGELLALAARATSSIISASGQQKRQVIYDIPRNTNRTSLGTSALAAGYRGSIRLEEHFLNGRSKTVSVYFGFSDWKQQLPALSTSQKAADEPINNTNICSVSSNEKYVETLCENNNQLPSTEFGTLLASMISSVSVDNCGHLTSDHQQQEHEIEESSASDSSAPFLPFLPICDDGK